VKRKLATGGSTINVGKKTTSKGKFTEGEVQEKKTLKNQKTELQGKQKSKEKTRPIKVDWSKRVEKIHLKKKKRGVMRKKGKKREWKTGKSN